MAMPEKPAFWDSLAVGEFISVLRRLESILFNFNCLFDPDRFSGGQMDGNRFPPEVLAGCQYCQ